MTKKSKRNVWLDVFKYFLAFLVVCIHTYSSINNFNFLPLCNIAVPMFFIISGYFSYKDDYNDELISAKKAIKRNFVYMIIPMAAAFVGTVGQILFVTHGNLNDYFYEILNEKMFFNSLILNSFPRAEYVWFVIALFLISVVQYFLVKNKCTNWLNYILPIGMAFLMTTYINKIAGGGVYKLNSIEIGYSWGTPALQLDT